MTRSGCAVHTTGLGSALVSARKRLTAAWRSTIEQNTPRLSRRRVSLENKVSTDEAGMSCQPGLHFGMLVGSIVVEDDMNDLADRRLRLDGVEKRMNS